MIVSKDLVDWLYYCYMINGNDFTGIRSTDQSTFPLRSVLSSMLTRMRNGTFSSYVNLVVFFSGY